MVYQNNDVSDWCVSTYYVTVGNSSMLLRQLDQTMEEKKQLIFLQQYCWRFKSSRLLHRVIGK